MMLPFTMLPYTMLTAPSMSFGWVRYKRAYWNFVYYVLRNKVEAPWSNVTVGLEMKNIVLLLIEV